MLYFVVFSEDKKYEYLLNYNIKENRTNLVYKTNGHISSLSISKYSSYLLFIDMKTKTDTVSVIIFSVIDKKIIKILDITNNYFYFAGFYPNIEDEILLIRNKGFENSPFCQLFKYSISEDEYYHVGNISCSQKQIIGVYNWCITSNNNMYLSNINNKEQYIIRYNLEEMTEYVIKRSTRITNNDISWINCAANKFILYKPFIGANIMLYEDTDKKKVVDNVWGSNLFVKLSPDGRLLSITLLNKGIIEIYEIDNKKIISCISGINATMTEWNTKSNSLYIISEYSIIYKYDLAGKRLKKLWRTPSRRNRE